MTKVRSLVWSFALLSCACSWRLASAQTDWPSAGHDLNNSRNQIEEHRISPKTAPSLKLRWAVNTDGDVTANPAVDSKYLYFPDSAGFLYKVARRDGAIIWKIPVSHYTGITDDYARATPAITGDTLILGNGSGHFLGKAFGAPDPQPAQVFAVNTNTGEKLWSTQVDPTPMSYITHSALVADGLAIVGTASNEELIAGFVPPPYWRWQFRGSIAALDVHSGQIKWQTHTVPPGYYGGSVWGSTGAIDRARRRVYMATGNNYAVPQPVLDCLNKGGTPPTCISPDDHFDSIIALDLDSGAVKWSARGLSYDTWNVGCGLNVPGVFAIPPNANCPNPKGPDWDFAQGPILLGNGNDDGDQLVGAGQKSGMFWAFRANDGGLAWSTQAGPPGLTGGLQWGSAVDGKRIFVAISNSGLTGSGTAPLPWPQADGTTTTAGGWAALDRRSGRVLWTTKDPSGSRAEAAVSVANGVMFGCNLDPAKGTMYALDAATGAPLWSYDSGGACNAGPSIADGTVFWGSGRFTGQGPKKLFAFSVYDKDEHE